MGTSQLAVVIAAYNEGDRIADTVGALDSAFPGAKIFVADDGSTDDTAARASQAGAEVVSSGKLIGKGGAATLGAQAALLTEPELVLLCDGDLAQSAAAQHASSFFSAAGPGLQHSAGAGGGVAAEATTAALSRSEHNFDFMGRRRRGRSGSRARTWCCWL